MDSNIYLHIYKISLVNHNFHHINLIQMPHYSS
jgi:hypothetical protein